MAEDKTLHELETPFFPWLALHLPGKDGFCTLRKDNMSESTAQARNLSYSERGEFLDSVVKQSYEIIAKSCVTYREAGLIVDRLKNKVSESQNACLLRETSND